MPAEPAYAADPQYRAFEAAILADPDDDTPRLVLADWLEDRPEPAAAARAEFIRAQVEREALPRGDPRGPGLARRERELLQAHEEDWLAPLQGMVSEVHWSRGFVHRVKLGVRQFMDHAETLFRHAPILDAQLLRVSQTNAGMEELARCPELSRLRGLRLPRSSVGDGKLAELFTAARLDALETLDLSASLAGVRTLTALRPDRLPRLRTLTLDFNPLENALPGLTNHSWRLDSLGLSNATLGDADRAALFSWPGLASVKSLDLGGILRNQSAVRQLADCPHLAALRSLGLSSCGVGVRGLERLAEVPWLSGLEELNLRGTGVRGRGLQALLRNPTRMPRLRKLDLAGNDVKEPGVRWLAAWEGLAGLTDLDLSDNGLTAADMGALCGSPHLRGLMSLHLAHDLLGGDGGRALACCEPLASLRELVVVFAALGEDGVAALLDSPHLAGLEVLRIDGNSPGRACMARYAERFPDAPKVLLRGSYVL